MWWREESVGVVCVCVGGYNGIDIVLDRLTRWLVGWPTGLGWLGGCVAWLGGWVFGWVGGWLGRVAWLYPFYI